MKHKPYNVRFPFTGKGLEHDMRLRRDLHAELAKSVEHLKALREIVVQFQTLGLVPNWTIFKELEMLNADLSDALYLTVFYPPRCAANT